METFLHAPDFAFDAAKNLGSLRRIVLNIIKLDTSTKDSVPKKRLRALLDTNYRQQILPLA